MRRAHGRARRPMRSPTMQTRSWKRRGASRRRCFCRAAGSRRRRQGAPGGAPASADRCRCARRRRRWRSAQTSRPRRRFGTGPASASSQRKAIGAGSTSMHELEASLAQMRNAWLAGRTALDQAPAGWREAIGGADELALAALAGHATDVLTRRAPAAPLLERPLLPGLPAPLVPEALRPRMRRLLAAPKNMPSLEQPLIAFVAARGYAAHPADWMPDAKDDWAPDLYAPWLDWVRAEASAAGADGEITAETYDEWSWTERRKALQALRAREPAQALAIIAAKAGGEPAERRVRLIELLQARLSEADAGYLESVAKDRSDRVQALARAFLARLGRDGDTAALAAELAAMVELTKTGLMRRRAQLVIKALKTGAQAARRRELFGLVSLAALANALNAAEAQLVESAPAGALADACDFAACVAATGSDAAVRALTEHVLESGEAAATLLLPLAGRLTAAERSALVPRLMARDADLFETTLLVGGELGQAPLAALTASPNYTTLRSEVDAAANGADAARSGAARVLDLLLPRIGLLLDAASARALLAQITAWGLSPAEPRLDMLHFSAALTLENAT